MGTPSSKPEKNLEFFRQKNFYVPIDGSPGKLQ